MMVMSQRKAAKRKRRTFPKPEPQTVALPDALSEAYGEITALAEEMREWAGNMEEKFSGTSKYETVNGTADELENISEPEVPESLKTIQVTFMPLPQRGRGYSRADRMGQAAYILDQCMEALDTFANEHNDAQADAEELHTAIENDKDAAESVEFPGMYG